MNCDEVAAQSLVKKIEGTKSSEDVLMMNKFMEMLHKDPDRAYYGYKHVLRALENDAIDTLMVTDSITDQWGKMMAKQTKPIVDGLIAATAIVHGLTVATRNVKDFRDTGVKTINPFNQSS